MNLPQLLKNAGVVVKKHSPEILTAVAVTGTVTTAALTARAAFRIGKDVNAGHYENIMAGVEPEYYDAKNLVKTYWKEMIPPVAVGAATVACIIGTHSVHTRRNAALATVYTLTEKAFVEYKDKVVEQFGEAKERQVRDAVAQDQLDKNPVSTNQVIIAGGGDVLCYESMTGRYFKSDMETLRKAQNTVNAQIINEMYASQNDFFREIGLPTIGFGDEVGWNNDKLLELQFSTMLADDGNPCIVVGYQFAPVKDYHRFR